MTFSCKISFRLAEFLLVKKHWNCVKNSSYFLNYFVCLLSWCALDFYGWLCSVPLKCFSLNILRIFSKAVSISFAHVIGMGIVTFLAILWPFQQLNDLFCDIFGTFVTFLWPFQHFCDLFVNDKKGHNFMNDKMTISRSNYDLDIVHKTI